MFTEARFHPLTRGERRGEKGRGGERGVEGRGRGEGASTATMNGHTCYHRFGA